MGSAQFTGICTIVLGSESATLVLNEGQVVLAEHGDLKGQHALDAMLKGKGTELDAVVELEVDDSILLSRIETRAAETAGGARADDNAEALAKRLTVYHEQTAPLIAYYKGKGKLKTVDVMKDMDEVTRQIEAALGL